MRLTTKDLITKEECLTEPQAYDYILKSKLQFYVYFLVDPFSFQIKYIGKGQGGRAFKHFWTNNGINPKKQKWLDKLYKIGREPLYVIWEFYDDEETSYTQENNFINMFGRKGIDNKGTLLNRQIDFKYNIGSLGLNKFIKEAKEVHGDKYDYSKSIYRGYHEPIDIICKIHGVFTQSTAGNHLKGQGCYYCNLQKARDRYNLGLEGFKEKSLSKFGKGHFDILKVIGGVYNNVYDMFEIKCLKHNHTFIKNGSRHLYTRYGGCDKCAWEKRVETRMSKGSYNPNHKGQNQYTKANS